MQKTTDKHGYKMEELIKSYNFSKEDQTANEKMSECLHNNIEKYAKDLRLDRLKKIVSAYSAKVCVKGFKETQNPKTDWMSYKMMKSIYSQIEMCIKSKRMTKQDCQGCMFELLIALLKSGPGVTQMELINTMFSVNTDMKEYLQFVNGVPLKNLIDALKQHHYTEDGSISIQEYCSCFKSCISYIVDCIVGGDKKRVRDKNVQSLMLDLHITYLLHISQLPKEFEVCLSACLNSINYYYDQRSVYVGCKDLALLKQHLKIITGIVNTSTFPRSTEEVQHVATTVQSIIDCCIKDSHVTNLWEELLSMNKCFCLCTGSSQMSPVLVTYKALYTNLPKKLLQNDAKVFQKWAAMFIDILNEVRNDELLVDFVPCAVNVMLKNTVAKAGDEERWIGIVQGLLKHPHEELIKSAGEILDEIKLKNVWSWKKNIEGAKKIIQVVQNVDFSRYSSERDLSSIFYEYGQTIHALVEKLRSAKVVHLAMDKVIGLVTHVLKMRLDEANQIIAALGELELEKNKELLPELLNVFGPLFKDPSYPWKSINSSQAGLLIARSSTETYHDGSEIPDKVNKSMIDMFNYCMDDKVERHDEENDVNTVFGLIFLTVLPSFCQKHMGKKSAITISPLIPGILKMLNDSNESMCEGAKSLILQIGTMSPQVLAKDLKMLIQWCLDTESSPDSILYVIPSIYPHNTEPMANKFQQLYKKFCVNICMDNYGYSIPLLMKVAELQPQLFHKEHIDGLCKYLDDTLVQFQILTILSTVSAENPDVICDCVKHLLSITDKNILQNGAYYINQTVLNVASKHQNYVKPAFEYFMKRLKSSTKDQNMSLQMIDSLQKLSDKYQPQEQKVYRECLNELKRSGVTPFVRTTATNLLQDLDNRK